nr:hypothetical protein [uncultured Roseovarius sp.]
MTPREFKEAREALGYTQAGLAAEWGMGKNGGRSIRKWESGDIPPNPIAAYCLRMMLCEAEA